MVTSDLKTNNNPAVASLTLLLFKGYNDKRKGFLSIIYQNLITNNFSDAFKKDKLAMWSLDFDNSSDKSCSSF